MAISCRVGDTGGWLLQECPSSSRLFERVKVVRVDFQVLLVGSASQKRWQNEKETFVDCTKSLPPREEIGRVSSRGGTEMSNHTHNILPSNFILKGRH